MTWPCFPGEGGLSAPSDGGLGPQAPAGPGQSPGLVLIIAGSDSGAGAGLQADLKTVSALGGYATTAVTALTAQNTLGVQGVMPVPPAFLRLQLASILDDFEVDAIKTGMLGDAETMAVVIELLTSRGSLPAVIDPVMVAKGGASLLAEDAVALLRARLLPLATVLTPNLPEAEALLGHPIADAAAMPSAAQALLALGPRAVLLKGGHLAGDVLVDVLATANGIERFTADRIPTRHTHGTGCTLASAVAAGLAQRLGLRDAVQRARAYVQAAIAAAPGLGHGHGPLNHAVRPG